VAPKPRASGEPGLPAAARYFGGFVPRRDWNRPGCPVRITKLEQVQLSVGGWNSPLAALQVSLAVSLGSSRVSPFVSLLRYLVLSSGCVNPCLGTGLVGDSNAGFVSLIEQRRLTQDQSLDYLIYSGQKA